MTHAFFAQVHFETVSKEGEEVLLRRNSAYMAVEGSRYDRYLPDWLDAFGDRLRIVFFDDWKADPGSVLGSLADWLEIAPAGFAPGTRNGRNQTVRLRSSSLHRIAGRLAAATNAAPGLQEHLRKLYYRVNGAAADGALPEAARGRIEQEFASGNARTARLLRAHGMPELPGWLAAAEVADHAVLTRFERAG